MTDELKTIEEALKAAEWDMVMRGVSKDSIYWNQVAEALTELRTLKETHHIVKKGGVNDQHSEVITFIEDLESGKCKLCINDEKFGEYTVKGVTLAGLLRALLSAESEG